MGEKYEVEVYIKDDVRGNLYWSQEWTGSDLLTALHAIAELRAEYDNAPTRLTVRGDA